MKRKVNIVSKMIAERYRIDSGIGEGGMADVYLAMDTILKREVAIKILRGELSRDPITLLRFQREASAVSKMNHPNIVDVYDVGEYEGRHYIVMEYIHGRTLKQLISQRGALDQQEAVDIMMQITSAVVHAHEHNIIHRDIKPQNILVKDDGTVKITDFGIALAHDSVQLTQSDAVLGSAHYLAPETTRGETQTNQVDIYALGIVFYELLSGSVPFRGDNPVQIAMKHLREDVPDVRSMNPSIWQSVENIIRHATVKNRKFRYQSAKEMLYDLEHCLTPACANAQPLLFPQEEDPTRKVVTAQENRQMKARKAKVMEIEEDEEAKPKKKKSYKGIIIALVVFIIILLATILFIVISDMRDKPKIVEVPNVIEETQEDAIAQLIEIGFLEENITIETKLDDEIEEGDIISLSPSPGAQISQNSALTLTVSSGTYFQVDDYTYRRYEDVRKELLRENPNLRLNVTYRQFANKEPGMIIEQSGLAVGEKIDPSKVVELNIVVTQSVNFIMPDYIGKSIEEVKADLKSKGIEYPIEKKLFMDDLSDEEIANIQKGVVVKTDPVAGTNYVQTGNALITLYYY